MLTVKKSYEEVDNWNRKAKTLVKDLEDTIEGVSRLLSCEKENVEPKGRKAPIKAFQILTYTCSLRKKPVGKTLEQIIKVGIYNLRKSVSPAPSKSIRSSCASNRSTSIEPVFSSEKSKKPCKAKAKAGKTATRGRSQERKPRSKVINS